MRRRGLVPRLIVTLASAWFALLTVLPSTLRDCPMHRPQHAAAVNAGSDPAASAPHDHVHAEHDAAAAEVADAEMPAPQDERAPCDCERDCCSVPAVAGITRPPRVHGATVALAESVSPTSALLRATSRTGLLPFAIGPPALTAG